MGKDLLELLKDALIKAEELEKRNKQLEEEIGNVNVEKWELNQEIDKLKKEVKYWKTVSFKV